MLYHIYFISKIDFLDDFFNKMSSETDYTYEYLTVSKDFVKQLDHNYQIHKEEIIKQLVKKIEQKYNIKIIKKE